MITYKYTAREKVTGKKVTAEVQAESEKGAAKLLQERGLIPLDISTAQGRQSGLIGFLKRVPAKERVIFSRQLSTLINAGLPLVQSLRMVSDQITNKTLKVVIDEVITSVEAGSAFSAALAKHPKIFNQVYISMVAAGEASGTLDQTLDRLATQQEKDAEIIAKVRGAMMYPAIVILVMCAVVVFMLTTVLPQVQTLYEGLPGQQLPVITRLLLAVSTFLIHDWYFVLIGLGILTFFGTRYARTGPGKQIVDAAKMRMWPIGTLFTKLYMARFTRTGATLIGSGVPLLQMLGITAEAVANVHVASSINKAAEKVKGGKALSASLEGDPNFLVLVPSMIRIGEQSGALETMLAKTADYYEKEVDNQIKNISTIIEPVLMIILGVVAITIVAAILLPIYGLVGKDIIK